MKIDVSISLIALLVAASPSRGLEFHPRPPEDLNSSLIWYSPSNPNRNSTFWIDQLDDFLEAYKKPLENAFECDYDKPPPSGKVCDMDLAKLNPCNSEEKYGYPKTKPCVFLKLNEPSNWIPETYDDLNDLPSSMPAVIKYMKPNNTGELNTIWLSCDGESPADKENIGPIRFFPRRGFPGFHFPLSKGHRNPLVAIQFEKPMIGVIINVECKVWAKNLNQEDQRGSVRFELLIDE